MQDAQADFSAYKTFGWEPDTSVALSLLDQNIRGRSRRRKGKGYEEAAVVRPRTFSCRKPRARKVKSNPIRIGAAAATRQLRRRVGVSSSGVKNVSEGTLVIHAVDPARKAEVQRPRRANWARATSACGHQARSQA
jgi:hypothetical protein